MIVVSVVANAMAMAIIERTREIGALRVGTLPGQLLCSLGLEGALLAAWAPCWRGGGAGHQRAACMWCRWTCRPPVAAASATR